MSDGVEFQITGLDEVLRKMKKLPLELRKKAARVAGRKGANVIARAVKANAKALDRPETPNNISANVKVQFASRVFRQTGDIQFRVGIAGGAKQYADNRLNRRQGRVGKAYNTGGSTFYWRFLEFGTQHAPARPFMRPAMEASINPATEAVVTEMGKQIDKLVAKGSG